MFPLFHPCLPAIFSSVNLQADTGMGIAVTVLILLVVLICIPAIIYVERAQRRIPVSYAKRVSGRRMMGGQSSYLPLKVMLLVLFLLSLQVV